MPKPTFKLNPRKQGKSKRVKLVMYGKNITQQQFKDDCDINKIMARFVKTGVLEHVRQNNPEGEYGFASSDTFRDSMEIVADANSMFESLPSAIRNEFENDPAKFLEFAENPENLPQMQEMGLANKLQPDPPTSLPKSPEGANAEGMPNAPPPAPNDPSGTDRRGRPPAEGTPAGGKGD